MLFLLRLPCLQEDEGNIHPVGVFPTQAAMAMFLRDDQTHNRYFHLGDYRYIGGLSSPSLASDSPLREFVPARLHGGDLK